MKKKAFIISKEEFGKLPGEIQDKTKETLRAYSEVHVDFYDGEYHVSTGIMLRGQYPKDFKSIGYVYADDVYTLEERTQNYIECFHDYPIWYKGKRDYKALKEKYGDPPIMD